MRSKADETLVIVETFFELIFHFYSTFTRKRVVSLYVKLDIFTRLEVNFSEVPLLVFC